MKTKTVHAPVYTTRDISSIIRVTKFFIQQLRTKSLDSLQTFNTTNGKKNMKKFIPLALLLIIVGGIVLLASRIVIATSKPITTDNRAVVQGPKASVDVNKEFSFPLTDNKGKELTRIKYVVQQAELRDEIIVKGTRATSVTGRTFLILTIKLVNEYDKAIDLKARDYLRLSVNGNNSELLAADIHNDPVNLQPISTKITRLGFPINDTDTTLLLHIGEIKGEKETVPLHF